MLIKIYFAAPLFTQAERIWNHTLTNKMVEQDSRLEIFLPQKEATNALIDGCIDFLKIQQICLNGIDSSDVLVAILDGSDSDSGTCFECGYAYSKNKKIIGVRTDLRAGEDQGLNAMLSQSCSEVIHFTENNDAEHHITELSSVIIGSVRRWFS